MSPEKAQIFNRLIMAGITFSLIALALSPFFGEGNASASGYNKVIVEYSISKDFYSDQGRSFVDAENLEKFVFSPKEGENNQLAEKSIPGQAMDSSQEDSFRP